jgi:hypothetical protein
MSLNHQARKVASWTTLLTSSNNSEVAKTAVGSLLSSSLKKPALLI